MSTSFNLPDLGEGIHEAEVITIHVNPGQEVKEGDIILEVETDKAAVEIPSPFTGRVVEISVTPGDIVHVGDAMITFSSDEYASSPPEKMTRVDPKQNGDEEGFELTSQKQEKIVPASPATRRLARELGVDLHLVTPTGSGSVVTADDVRQFSIKTIPATSPPVSNDTLTTVLDTSSINEPCIPKKEPPPLPDFSQWGEVEREPLRSIRRATATHMSRSWSQIPHVTTQDSVDISKLESFRNKHKAEIAEAGGKLTLTVFALKAAATALKRYPYFNSSLDENAQEIITKNYFHLGIATDTERGLFVPVIKDVDRKSIKEIAIELNKSVEQCRAGKIQRENMSGGTFTITNAGATGGEFFTAIINHPQVAILGMGQARMKPTVVTEDDGKYQITPRLIMPLVLTFDHRVVDGADAIRFLRVIIDALEDPEELLITMI